VAKSLVIAMRTLLLAALVPAAVAGCPANHGSQTPPTGTNSMSPGFSKAHVAVRDYAARFYGIKPDDISVMPDNEATANVRPMGRIGRLWAFDAQAGDETITVLAAPDGRVVSHQQNLGLLFEEAGVWTDSPTLNADQLAAQIVESMASRGMNHRVYDWSVPPPELTLDPSGAGTLVFQVGRKQRGPGGSGGGPEFRAEAKVVLTPDHQAKLELGPWQNP
jgi:hypothetical protein